MQCCFDECAHTRSVLQSAESNPTLADMHPPLFKDHPLCKTVRV